MPTIKEKIDFINKLTEDRTKRANEVVKKIKLVDTTNIKLDIAFKPGEQYSKTKSISVKHL